MNNQAAVTDIANEAVNQLEVACEYMRWSNSLGYAISSSIENGHTHHAAQLAGIAQYLANEYQNILDRDIKRFNDQIKTLDIAS